MMTTDIRIAQDQDEIDACMKLRKTVFVEEQGVSEEEESDGEDNACSHVLAQIGGKPVGAARFRLVDDYVKIQRVCVLKLERGKNIGAEIIQFIVKHANEAMEAKTVRLGAQVHALEFYRKLGFLEEGEEYMDASTPHMDMELQLSEWSKPPGT
jgi:predicted GNAT family N-acyltransferase